MTSVFSRIIAGELPGHLLHADDLCVALLDIAPVRDGHAIVVPRDEVDHWVDLSPQLAAHLMVVAHRVGRAQRQLFGAQRIGLLIAGFEVPHAHVHVIPIEGMAAFDLGERRGSSEPAELAAVAERLRIAVAAAGV